MKFLSSYVEEGQTRALRKAGAFFAFSNSQFDENKQEGIKYVDMGMGLICPKETADVLFKESEEIYFLGIKQDIEENGIDAIIERELDNHEVFYTGNTEPTEDALKHYGITIEDIRRVYNKIYKLKNI